ncbi:UspA domain-containing protein [metagenome]
MLFKNILVPWDGSTPSLHAFKFALDIAKKYDSKISVIHCIQNEAYRGQWFPDSRYSKAIIKKQTKSAEAEIDKLAVLAKNKGVQISSTVLVAPSIVKQIVTYVKSKKMDLVIMGSHGRTGFSKTLYGSVANGVSQNIRCPVLIVR